eukprot:4430691-Prymnesium_polylepis.1
MRRAQVGCDRVVARENKKGRPPRHAHARGMACCWLCRVWLRSAGVARSARGWHDRRAHAAGGAAVACGWARGLGWDVAQRRRAADAHDDLTGRRGGRGIS